MTLQEVRQAQAAERAAKDAFYALHSTIKTGGKTPANYSKLQGAMIAATKARQAAVAEYSAKLFGCTPDQVRKQQEANAAQLLQMANKAKKTGKKVNGYTAEALAKLADSIS
jgi:hypothetical protein